MQDPQSAPSRTRRVSGRSAVVAGFLLVAVLLVATSIVTSSPAVCARCHASQASALHAGGHSGVPCYQCHLSGGAWGIVEAKTAELTRMYPAALLGRGMTVPARMTERAACMECHKDLTAEVTDANGVRIKHGTCARDDSCDGCHSSVAHEGAVRWVSAPSMGSCVACHTSRGASTECDTCHSVEGRRKQVNGEWQVVHGANWKSTHGLGDQKTCGTCHPADYCQRCHKVPVPHPVDFGKTHGKLAVANDGACKVCHKSSKDFCDVCHGGTAMPHPDGFIQGHTTVAASTEDPKCIRCHVDTDCEDCHRNHVHPGGSEGVPIPWTVTPEALRP